MSILQNCEAVEIADQALAIEPGQNRTEFIALLSLLHGRRIRNFLEIGTEGGCTFYAWCKVSEPEGVKISLDWGWGASGTGRFRDRQAREERDERLKTYAENVYRIEGDSHLPSSRDQVDAILSGESLDFLFIDGDHAEAGVRQDWLDYGPLVRPGGIVAFHDVKNCDYHVRAGCFVHEFWAKLEGVKKVEFLNEDTVWGGIGVVFV